MTVRNKSAFYSRASLCARSQKYRSSLSFLNRDVLQIVLAKLYEPTHFHPKHELSNANISNKMPIPVLEYVELYAIIGCRENQFLLR